MDGADQGTQGNSLFLKKELLLICIAVDRYRSGKILVDMPQSVPREQRTCNLQGTVSD